MTYQDVVTHFKTPAEVARALRVSSAAVAQWRERVPLGRQYQIELLTGGKLRASQPQREAA
jgi:hypothetical protein